MQLQFYNNMNYLNLMQFVLQCRYYKLALTSYISVNMYKIKRYKWYNF